MRSAVLASALVAAVLAAPTKRQATQGGPSDGVILNYALTLEHLENAFYQEVLQKFTLEDFQAVGLDNVFYENLKTISGDEATHVEFLTTALTAAGVTPVVANEYEFGLTDVTSFLTLSNVLEGVGVSAYLGAAQYIASGAYLTAAGSILTVEARHSAYLKDSNRPQQYSPFPSPFDTPLTINEVYTLAAPFITKNNNPDADLPVMAYVSLAYAGGAAAIGETIELTAASEVQATEAYFISITGPISAPLTGSGTDYSVTIPEGTPAGQSYVVLTSGGVPSDSNIVAGPAIVIIQDAQYGIVRDTPECKNGGSDSGNGGSAPSYSSGSGSSAPAYSAGSSTGSAAAPYKSEDASAHPSAPVYESADGQITHPATGAKAEEDCEEAPAAAAHY